MYLRRNDAQVNINSNEAPFYAFTKIQAVLEMRPAQQSNELYITVTYMLHKGAGKMELEKISEVLTDNFFGVLKYSWLRVLRKEAYWNSE